MTLTYFRIIEADTPALKKECYRLRYNVYCRELGVLPKENYPDELEVDDCDQNSRHFLIRHCESGLFAATVRMVLNRPEDDKFLFPMERKVRIQSPITADILRDRIGEVSRFCVACEFRKRKGEWNEPCGVCQESPFDGKDRRCCQHITLTLIAIVNRCCEQLGLTHWYALMRTPMFRLLKSYGVHHVPLAPRQKAYGDWYMPTIIKFPEYLETTRRERPDVAEIIAGYAEAQM